MFQRRDKMSILLKRPTKLQPPSVPRRYEKFYLTENPFPLEPSVNQDSTDKRMNGNIYETEIHKKEFQQITQNFLKQPQSNPNHLRLGYIVDTSYVGRGNGKSAFLVNLQQLINRQFCLDISEGSNKCFAVIVRPEPGGRTKTFESFINVFFQDIVRTGMIDICLATLRLEAIKELRPDIDPTVQGLDDDALVGKLNTREWFSEQNLNLSQITETIYKNKYLQNLPEHFPLFAGRSGLIQPFVSRVEFQSYYLNDLKRSKDKIDFVFSHLVDFFMAAGYNGAYVLVDDYERIPDFQTERQKKDFALELRSCLFDGLYTNARIGFYNFLLVFHAGVPRLIGSTWEGSGMEQRAPILPKIKSKHLIRFEKLSKEHAILLLEKYLAEYRTSVDTIPDPLYPFKEDAVSVIGELSEYNAARILKIAYELLEKAADSKARTIDASFVNKNRDVLEEEPSKRAPTIREVGVEDLQKKARRKK
jgi:hypothetical protein